MIVTCGLLSMIFLPSIACCFLGSQGRYLGRNSVYFLGCCSLGGSLILCLWLGLSKVWQGLSLSVYLTAWLGFLVDWTFIFDSISLQMCILILTITLCVVLYSSEYMYTDMHAIRFVCLLLLFSFFMLMLVSSNNLVQIFIGWEGVGLVSYLLINFWFMRLEANRSAVKAMLFNRIGDSFFLLGLCFIVLTIQTIDLLSLQNLNYLPFIFQQIGLRYSFGFNMVDLILICFFLASMGKSAQLFLHAWLPDAMEGPTPVSSLLHSATMVTAGVFVLIRFSSLFTYSTILNVFIFIGASTAFLNGVFGFFQNDLKKIIAFSTCSQLGLMFVGVMYNATVGFYHLVNHGFFKALLFLSAGSIIHSLGGEQDIRKMGGLFRYLPYTNLCLLFGSLALTGFPFLSGFYSKEFILFMFYSMGDFFSLTIFSLLFFASMFTVLYSIKILKNVFFVNTFNSSFFLLANMHESQNRILISMFFLTGLSVVFGFFYEDLFNNFGSFKIEHLVGFPFLLEKQNSFIFFNLETSDFVLKISLTSFFLLFFFVCLFRVSPHKYLLFLKPVINNMCTKFMLILFWIVSNRLGFISFYRILTSSFLTINYYLFFLLLDRGFFELLGSTQVVRLFHQTKLKITSIFFIPFSMFFIVIFNSILCLFSILTLHSFLLVFLFFLFFFNFLFLIKK